MAVQFAFRRGLTNIFVGYIPQKNNRKGKMVEYKNFYVYYQSKGKRQGGKYGDCIPDEESGDIPNLYNEMHNWTTYSVKVVILKLIQCPVNLIPI